MAADTTIADSCDRHPSAHGMTAWYRSRDRSTVVLCGHCTKEHGLALVAQEFELALDDRDSLTPQPEPA